MTVYGRGKGGVFNPFDMVIQAAGDRTHLTLPFSRTTRFWMIHVDDAAEVFADLATAETVQHTMYNAPSERLTMAELAETLGPLCGLTIDFEEPGRQIDQVAGLDYTRLAAEFPIRFRTVKEWAVTEMAQGRAVDEPAVVRTDAWNGFPGASSSGYVLRMPPGAQEGEA